MPVNPPAAGKKKLFIGIIIGTVALVLATGGAVAWFVNRCSHADDEESGICPRRNAPVASTFLPLENMVVNLADPGGDRFAQIGITLELEDARAEDKIRQHLPVIRNAILMLVSQCSSAELLQRNGKEKLAADILREVSRPLGYPVLAQRERAAAAGPQQSQQEAAPGRASSAGIERNPVRRVLFSSFIIQ
ncbi:flagellar basal body-associated FliL family protein [Verminephrobacter eiseniae]|uniref:flagellar basal body-associated FliL family protein n=1 Tax=Verminephrobacter eiseniae TaxID=364317 RepID=UPI0038B2927D|nr:flagellar basal body protein FliL [Verminephrobacter eiseniae]